MNADQITLLLIKGTIAELPADDQVKVAECLHQVKSVLAGFRTEHAMLAVAQLGAEVSIDPDAALKA